MDDFQSVKLEIFIPAEFVPALREALALVGAGRIGDYDHCVSVTPVRGYWRPLAGANPFDGTVGEVSTGAESKVEVNCACSLVRAALQAIRQVHPYEEPLINVVPLVNHLFE
jgi:hypothetical protein